MERTAEHVAFALLVVEASRLHIGKEPHHATGQRCRRMHGLFVLWYLHKTYYSHLSRAEQSGSLRVFVFGFDLNRGNTIQVHFRKDAEAV